MKHNWEYKRLGEVCSFIGGGTPSKSNGDFYTGNIPWATVRDMIDYKLSSTDLRITPEAVKQSATNILPKGMIVISTHVGLGKICELMQDTAINQDLKGISFSNNSINKHFFVQWYRSIADYIISNGKGATVKGVTLDFMRNLAIPVPPIEVQEQIVAELDQINDLITKNRELLKQLDALAQSLFYDTFGDPISNPKGWEIRKLSSISQLINGRAFKQEELHNSGKYRVIRVGNFFTNSDYYYSDLELDPDKYIENGDLVFAWSASFGAFIWKREKVIYHYHIWKVLFDDKILNKIFYKFLLNEMTSSFMKDLHGIGMMHLTKIGMEQYLLPVPPLPLQEEFAGKVEAIEAQKARVEAEIAELQTLLDARMDYWFN